MTFEKVKIVRLLINATIMFYKQAYHPFLTPEELYKQQHCYQNKMHVLIQLENSNWFTKKNK